jgi:hypothetical protein
VDALAAKDKVRKYQRFAENGFVVVPDVVDGDQCEVLAHHVQALGNRGVGLRALLSHPWCAELAIQLRRNSELRALLPADAVAVQCTLFDKSPEKNWLVSLHQDLSIPVRHRVTSPDCSGWSEKDGQVYVQPPVGVLEQLVAVRVHIDDCPADTGALRVVAKSHVKSRLSRGRAAELRRENGETAVPVARGGALVMRPLILHASSKATSLASRRVLHFVFGPPRLPSGLEWHWAAEAWRLSNMGHYSLATNAREKRMGCLRFRSRYILAGRLAPSLRRAISSSRLVARIRVRNDFFSMGRPSSVS